MGSNEPQNEQNEFSRTVNTDRLLKTSSGKNYRNSNSRDYNMEITAKEDECNELAKRFDLKKIYDLSANLSLRRYNSKNQEGYSYGQSAIQVEGTVHSKVTQTCVRTNEDFQVDVEFPIFAIVKPSTNGGNGNVDVNDEALEAMLQAQLQQQQQRGGGKKKKKKKGPTKSNLKDDMMELNRLLSQQDLIDQSTSSNNMMDLDFGGDFGGDGDDSIIEDESIYSAITGILDVGELVAQTFWLQLDPYPKKPGTNPIQTSITG